MVVTKISKGLHREEEMMKDGEIMSIEEERWSQEGNIENKSEDEN